MRILIIKFLTFLFCSRILSFASLSAEIESVTLIWDPAVCIYQCHDNFSQLLSKIPGVVDVIFDGTGGKAVLKWDPTTPIVPRNIDNAIAMIGIWVPTITLKVKGKIDHSGTQAILTSKGDGTTFVLLGPTRPQLNGYAIEWSVDAHPMDPLIFNQLVETEKQHQDVLIEGPLFLRQSAPPNWLIVNSFKIVNPKQPAQQKKTR